MTLERWSLYRYQLPRLDIQAMRRLDDAVEVDSQRGVFRLTCDDASAIDQELLPTLNALRDPRSALWSAVRERGAETDKLIPMLRELDHLGLIRDSTSPHVDRVHQEIEHAVREWSSNLGREIAANGEHAAHVVERLAERLEAEPSEARIVTLEEPSFPLLTLLLQARYLREDAPAVLGLLIAGLRAAGRRARMGDESAWWAGIGNMPSWAEEEWSCGLVDPRLAQQYLVATGSLLREAFGPGAARRARSTRVVATPSSGINFILDLEDEVSRLLAELGPSPAIAAVQEPSLARSVVRAAFLQEYFVTCRFVECVAPLLSRRFVEPLRDSVHRYFAEEMGHEKFERENCLRLGLTERQIDEAGPFPLYLAYIDILTSIARQSPISFFCASMFTEGIIGTNHSLVSLALEAIPDDPMLVRAISDHVAVNEESDHRGVGRDWMSRVPLVSKRTQREVSELIAYLAELNWRMWDQLVQSCQATRAQPPR